MVVCKWMKCETSYSATALMVTGETFRLFIERKSAKRWDWCVWRADNTRAATWGETHTAKAGMTAAERVLATRLAKGRRSQFVGVSELFQRVDVADNLTEAGGEAVRQAPSDGSTWLHMDRGGDTV